MTRKEVRATAHKLHLRITSLHLLSEELLQNNAKRLSAEDELGKIKDELHALEIDLAAPPDFLVDSDAGQPLLNATSRNMHAIGGGLDILEKELREAMNSQGNDTN
jgi:hypothetical protein